MKNQKGKEKVVEKEKALPAFNRDDDSKNSSQLSSDIKELDEQIIKAIYVICSWHCVSNHFTYFGTFIQQKER